MSGHIRTLIWGATSLVTTGCFLVGNYELSESVNADTSHAGDTDGENSPGVDVTDVAPNDADASVAMPDRSDSSPSVTNSTPNTNTTSSAVNHASGQNSSDDVPSAPLSSEQSTYVSSDSEGTSTTADGTADGGTTGIETTGVVPPKPACPEDTTYDEDLDLCLFECENGQRAPNGRCYWLGPTAIKWQSVLETCTNLGPGWNMLTIRNQEEHDFVTSILQDDTWLGASDSKKANSWLWLDDDTEFWRGDKRGQPVDGAFVAWGKDEPSAAGDERCARYHSSPDRRNWSWSDCSCGSEVLWGPGPGLLDAYRPGCQGPVPVKPE
jgi:hypothetical protein